MEALGVRHELPTVVVSAHGVYRDRHWMERLGDEVIHEHFSDLSQMNGWSESPRTGAQGGDSLPLWETLDAGPRHPPRYGDAEPLVAWCHVGLLTAPEEQLPTESLLTCLGQTIDRLGALDLHAVQVLLPLHSLSAESCRRRQRDGSGSALGTPGVMVRTCLDAGQQEGSRRALAAMVGVGIATGRSLPRRGGPTAEVPTYVVGDAFWGGPPGEPVAFETRISSWDLPGVGRAVANVADAAVVAGAHTPVMLTMIGASAA